MKNRERQACLVYARVVGWLTPVQNWNKGKRAEFKDRKVYEIKEFK
jgi:ribonucleoside-triphosphate reductase